MYYGSLPDKPTPVLPNPCSPSHKRGPYSTVVNHFVWQYKQAGKKHYKTHHIPLGLHCVTTLFMRNVTTTYSCKAPPHSPSTHYRECLQLTDRQHRFLINLTGRWALYSSPSLLPCCYKHVCYWPWWMI